ncbi:N-acetylmuramoyl-L-alanine amidase [Proteiniborus ethanoligenes]|uniref:N-acetylmuramoyl-L-alanine amidase n=1 Tax=Proteiniborus ethanoligenes TaxID=415015 RepID=A0A1H3Q6M1_9FIRM|nr:N-acetylmuramoyl-L-alanine amidase [Proteiniborus ethanoligenes]SDZ08831.1 N-acetylmuramoyl-L-alanine amidase [Proteiniborus ethanoligenes]
MKKLIAVLMVFVMVIGVGNSVIAQTQQASMKVSINGKQVSVATANVTFNGAPIESDIPPMIVNDRILVPIRAIGNHLNADVGWNQESKEATIKTTNQEIILKVNSPMVLVNGVQKEIPYGIPAMLVNDARIMVPLRFVSEVLGCNVDWEQSTRTGIITTSTNEITGISVESSQDGNPKIILTTNAAIEYSERFMSEPDRLVIDINNSRLSISDKSIVDSNGLVHINVNKSPVKSVRLAQFSDNPQIIRLVIDLDGKIDYNIIASDDEKLVTISFLNNVKNISSKRINGRNAVVIENTEEAKYNMFRLSNPERVVIDILDSKLWTDSLQIDVDNEFIHRIRSSQFKPNNGSNNDKIVRVVLDIKEIEENANVMVDYRNKDIVVFVDDGNYKNIAYSNESKDEGIIEISLEKNRDYAIDYNEKSRHMEIKIDKDAVDIENGIMTINDENISSIIVDEEEEYKKITISFKGKIDYNLSSELDSSIIKILFKKIEENNGSKLIVIDAGHGGKDPGTTGPISKVKEKDLNLKVALKLDRKLRELGFRTILTRDKDEWIDLYERADIANRNDADAFVSIHFNSNKDKEIAGIQTYYCPAFSSEMKEGDNYPFAKAIHDAMLSGLNSKDKDIIKKPEFVVVRETKMVAVLLELGFVTNPAEEQLLITDAYHEKAAQAIANGIVKYFNEIGK